MPAGQTTPGLAGRRLGDQPLLAVAQALTWARPYARRGLIEDLHQALNTGRGAEKRPLPPGPRLLAAVSLLSVVALALVALRAQSRRQPDVPAEAAGLPSRELQV